MAQKDTNQTRKKPAKPQGGAQSIRRTIDILRSVSRFNKTGARLSTIARDVALPAPTAHRILTVLQEEDVLSFNPETKLYFLGTGLYALAAATSQFSLRDQYHSCLKRISDYTEDSAYLLVRSGYDGVCIDRVMGSFRVQVLGYEVGERRVLGIGAAGLALLSFLPAPLRDEILAANSPRYVKEFGVSPRDVMETVEQTRANRYSLSVHRVTSDSVGVGAPIFNTAGRVVAAVSMSAITKRLGPDRCREIARFMMDEISAVGPPSA
ncbi:IclR family transcriptional regulator [Desulfospira joergensenii]|uniref:IclR family transcriptional regulator n=1 Tax=Desulfospira joergensenii TaxID=53329 RepID=UPI0003B65C77|nr:IclR family transcriptional regulator [Desulfospira joergensenii]